MHKFTNVVVMSISYDLQSLLFLITKARYVLGFTINVLEWQNVIEQQQKCQFTSFVQIKMLTESINMDTNTMCLAWGVFSFNVLYL